MIDTEAAAASLYGTPAPTSARAAVNSDGARVESADQRDERHAADLYADGPEQPERSVYGEPLPPVLDPAQREIQSAALERFNLSKDEAQASAVEWGGVFRAYDVSPNAKGELAALGIGAMANPPDDAQVLSWQNAARSELTAAFGDSADLALADAQKLVADDPRLAEFLDSTGLGSHPRVVLQLAERARYLRTRGKL